MFKLKFKYKPNSFNEKVNIGKTSRREGSDSRVLDFHATTASTISTHFVRRVPDIVIILRV